MRHDCAHDPRFALRSEIIPDMKHWPEYEMHSAPWINVSRPRLGTRRANDGEIFERVLARQDDAFHAELLEHGGAGRIVHGHLRRAMNLEVWIELANQVDESEILYDRRVDPAVDGVPKKGECLDELAGLDEHIQCEIDAAAVAVGDTTRLGQLLERELRAFVARVEALGAQVDGIGAVGDGRANGVERTSGREKLGNRPRTHKV